MEFRLNKIDTSLRQKINDATKEGKVHGKSDVKVDKDKNREEKQKFDLKKYGKQIDNKITVSAIKDDQNSKCDVITNDNSKGKLIDVRK